MSSERRLIALLKAVLDSPTLNEQSDAIVVSQKIWRQIRDELAGGRNASLR